MSIQKLTNVNKFAPPGSDLRLAQEQAHDAAIKIYQTREDCISADLINTITKIGRAHV